MEKGWGSDSAPATPAGTVRPGAGKAPHPDHAAATPDSNADKWKSVDPNSGPMDPHDWSHATGKFPSEEGWEQT